MITTAGWCERALSGFGTPQRLDQRLVEVFSEIPFRF